MPSTVEDFKKKSRKVITLPSGLQIEIRKLWMRTLISAGEIPLPSAVPGEPQERTPEENRRLSEEEEAISAKIAVLGAVNPRLSDKDEDLDSAEVLHVSHLSTFDVRVLAREILTWSGSTGEVAAEADSFRDNQVGRNGKNAGGEIRQAADGDPKPESP